MIKKSNYKNHYKSMIPFYIQRDWIKVLTLMAIIGRSYQVGTRKYDYQKHTYTYTFIANKRSLSHALDRTFDWALLNFLFEFNYYLLIHHGVTWSPAVHMHLHHCPRNVPPYASLILFIILFIICERLPDATPRREIYFKLLLLGICCL